MPIKAEIEGHGTAEFPDDATPEEIAQLVNAHFAATTPAQKAPTGDGSTIGPMPLSRRISHGIQALAPNLLSTEEVPATGKPRGAIPNLVQGLNESPLHPLFEKAREDLKWGADPSNPFTGPKTKALAGAATGASEVLEPLGSPAGFGMMIAQIPKALQGALGLAFAAMGAKQATEAGSQLMDAIRAKDWGKVGRLSVEIVGGTGQAALGGVQAIHAIPKSANILPRAKAAAESAIKQEEVKPQIFRSDLEGGAKQSIENIMQKHGVSRDEAVSLRLKALDRFGLIKTPATTEVPNASKVSQATAVHGDVQPQPGQGSGEVSTEAGSAGVQPPPPPVAKETQIPLIKDEAAQLSKMPVADFHAEMKKRPGGLTGDAYRLGQAVKTPEDLKAIQDGQTAAKNDSIAARGSGDLTAAIAASTRGQYFREAYEAATGTGSAGESLRKSNPNYKPPMPPGERDFTPAVRGNSGKIYTAESHPEARELAKKAGESQAPRGYLTKDGQFVTLLDAARRQMTKQPIPEPATKSAQPATVSPISETKVPESETKAPAPTPATVSSVTETPLDPQIQEMLDLEREGIGHELEVAAPVNENEPFAKQIASINRKTGKIRINPRELTAWLKNNVPAGQERAAIRSLLSEESIHLATPDDAALDYHNSATAAERAIAQRVYGGRGGEPLSPTMLGHEMLRMRMQQLARMGVRETIEASNRERWTVKSLLAVSDAIRTIREVIGTKASKEAGAITDRIQDNIDAVLAEKTGETPAAKRKGSEERTGEFYLPPLSEPAQRPTASEMGALPAIKIPPEKALQTDTVLWNKPNAWRRITTELLHKPFSLGKMLTEGSRATEGDPVSLTRRLVAMEKNGKVDVVSIYPDSEDGARAVDPAYAGNRERPNVPIKSLLDEGYRPIVSMLRTDPVQNFHRHFDSVDQFEQTVGKPGDDQWANVQGYEAQTAATQAPSFGRGDEMVNTEAGALHDHFIEHDTVDKAVDAIAASPNVRQIRSGLGKAINQIMAGDKSLTREEAAGKAVEQLYEKSQSSEHRDDFIKNTLGEFGKESPEGAGHPPAETINDLGTEQPAEEESHPAAIRKFAADQIKLTDEDIRAYVTKAKVSDDVARAYDAAINIPNNIASKEEFGVRVQSVEKPSSKLKQAGTQWTRGKKDVLAAANAMVQAQAVRDNGTIDNARKSQLQTFRAQVQRGVVEANNWIRTGSFRQRRMGEAWLRSQTELMKELDYADAHWNDPDLRATASRMKLALDQQWRRERQAGFEVSKDVNYVPQRYAAAVWNEHSILFNAIEGTEKILGGRFRKPRTFQTYYEASGEGPYIPVTRDGASLIGHRVRQGMNMISREAWSEGLKSVNGPSGQPVAIDAKMNATGQLQPPASRDYTNMLVGGKAIAVHDDFVSLLDNLTSPSKVENWPIIHGALRLEQQMKHGMLLGDFFHLGRMGYYGLSIMGKNAGWKGGWSVLDIKPGDIQQAVAKGVISQSDADWGNTRVRFGNNSITRRELAQKFVMRGANLGKVQDALYKDLITDMTPAASPLRRGIQRVIDPSVGRYNRFLFDKLTRGLMAEANVREFERQSKANPSSNPDTLIKDISRDVNNYFGNIGKQGWIKSSTQKDLARLLFLAPDWLEGLIKKEATFYGRATGGSKLIGRREGVSNLGTTGRGIGRGLVFLLGLTQAINVITRRQPTWDNDEKGHKFDAWIPSWGGQGDGFWFSPFSIFNEITHDVWRYAQADKTVMGAVDQVIGNKESPLAHAAIIAAVGASAGKGQKFTTSKSQLAEAAKQLAPMPLTFGRYAQAAGHAVAPSLVSPPPPGSVQRQTFASAGLKTEPKASAAQEITKKAQDFAKNNGFTKETGWQQVPTDEASYSKLRSALRVGDEAEAKKQFEALRKGRTDKQIFHAMKLAKARPFAGSKSAERAFIASLDDRELEEYEKAVDQRTQEYQQFEDFALRQQ